MSFHWTSMGIPASWVCFKGGLVSDSFSTLDVWKHSFPQKNAISINSDVDENKW